MKFGIWILIGLAAFLWFNHAKRQRLKNRVPPASGATAAPEKDGEQIVACAHCGLHVPRSDAVVAVDGVGLYCSEVHRRLHAPA